MARATGRVARRDGRPQDTQTTGRGDTAVLLARWKRSDGHERLQDDQAEVHSPSNAAVNSMSTIATI